MALRTLKLLDVQKPHEVWGLNKNIRSLADRLAAEGYVIFAPDRPESLKKINQSLLAEVANPSTCDEAQKKLRAAMSPIMSEEFGKETVERLKICFSYLKREYKMEKITVMGFCFGGDRRYASVEEVIEA